MSEGERRGRGGGKRHLLFMSVLKGEPRYSLGQSNNKKAYVNKLKEMFYKGGGDGGRINRFHRFGRKPTMQNEIPLKLMDSFWSFYF